MKPLTIAMFIVIGSLFLGLLAFPGGARAARAGSVRRLGSGLCEHPGPRSSSVRLLRDPEPATDGSRDSLTRARSAPDRAAAGTTINMNTGEYLVVTWSFRYIGGVAVKGTCSGSPDSASTSGPSVATSTAGAADNGSARRPSRSRRTRVMTRPW